MVFVSNSELRALFVQYQQQQHRDCKGVHLHRGWGLFALLGAGRLNFDWEMPKPKAEKQEKK
jgi:hypothetical protein